jgi:hypothetical protein
MLPLKNLVRLGDRIEQNSKPDGWLIRIQGKAVVLFSAASAETHDPESLALAVYWPCREDESFDRPRRIGLLHTT